MSSFFETDEHSDLTVFDRPVIDATTGLTYYVFPKGYPLFKADKSWNKNNTPPKFEIGKHPFFGLKKMDEEYIETYETQYGVIFEFITTREYRLIALDKTTTQFVLHEKAPENIKTILEKNYGYGNKGIRDSVSEADRELSSYLCSKGYEGYAIHGMPTDTIGGIFNDELMICDATGIELVGQITPDNRAQGINDRGKSDTHAKNLKTARKTAKRNSFEPTNETSPPKTLKANADSSPLQHIFNFPGNYSYDSPPTKSNIDRATISPKNNNSYVATKLSFGDDDMSGGKKRRKSLRRKSNKRARKTGKTRKTK
jgi:hypothetical protein